MNSEVHRFPPMNILQKLLAVVASVSVLFAAGCVGPSASAPRTIPRDVGSTYVAPSGTGARTIDGIEYQYVATARRRAQIIAGHRKLKLGQSREEVRSLLGLPDRADPMYPKTAEPFLGWAYDYIIKTRADGPNMGDACVGVYFNPDGKLKWAVPCNIPGLKAVGGPSWEELQDVLTAARREYESER
jgi:hypothetical protein